MRAFGSGVVGAFGRLASGLTPSEGGGTPPPVPFDPTTDWTSAKLWLDASAGITLSSGDVAAWADQSGSGNDFVQGSAGARPLFVASDPDFAGAPIIQSDGVDDFLQGGTVSSVFGASGGTWIAVVRVDAVTAATSAGYDEEGLWGDGSGGFAQGTVSQSSGTLKLGNYIYDGAARNARVDGVVGTTCVIAGRHDGVDLHMSINGGAEVSVPCGTNPLAGAIRLFRGATLFSTVSLTMLAASDADEGTPAVAAAAAKLMTQFGVP